MSPLGGQSCGLRGNGKIALDQFWLCREHVALAGIEHVTLLGVLACQDVPGHHLDRSLAVRASHGLRRPPPAAIEQRDGGGDARPLVSAVLGTTIKSRKNPCTVKSRKLLPWRSAPSKFAA
jgi:hypothetical protein